MYDCDVPASFASLVPALAAVCGKYTPPVSNRSVTLASAGGTDFISFAKGASFNDGTRFGIFSFRDGRFSFDPPVLLRQTSTTPGWLRPFSPTCWSSSGSRPRASYLPTAPEIGRSRTSTTSSQASRLPSNTARTTPSGPSAPALPSLVAGEEAAGCVWATSTGTWRRRSAAAGRCASGTQWCGRPIERRC